MIELLPPTLPPLPLLLWETPPGPGADPAPGGRRRSAGSATRTRWRSAAAGSCSTTAARSRRRRSAPLLSPEHVALDIDLLRRERARPTRSRPWSTPTGRAATLAVGGWSLTERVARHAQGRDPPAADRPAPPGGRRRPGGLWARLAPFPFPYRSAFNFRADLDEPRRRGLRPVRPARAARWPTAAPTSSAPTPTATSRPCSTTCSGSTPSRTAITTSSTATARRTGGTSSGPTSSCVERGLRARRASPRRTAAGTPGSTPCSKTSAICTRPTSSSATTTCPFFPWRGDRFSRVLQVPIHPICEGLFLDAGARDGRVDRRPPGRRRPGQDRGGRAGVRLRPSRAPARPVSRDPRGPGRRRSAGEPLLWRVDADRVRPLVALAGGAALVARPARRRPVRGPVRGLAARVPARPGDRPRASTSSTVPLTGPRTSLRLDDLAYERRDARADLAAADRRAPARAASGRPSARRSTGRRSRRSTSCPPPRSRPGSRRACGGGGHERGREMIATSRPTRPRRAGVRIDRGWLARVAEPGRCRPGRSCSTPPRPSSRRRAGARTSSCRRAGTSRRWASRVRLFSPWTDRLEEARLLHLFGMSREGLELARVARARGRAGRALADLLVSSRGRSPRWRRARRGRPGDLAKWALKPSPPALAELAARAARAWPTRSCRTRGPRRGSSSGSSAPTRGASTSCPTASSPAFADGRRPTLFRDAFGAGRLRPLRRPDRAAEERPRADPGGRGRWACRWSSSATPRRATRATPRPAGGAGGARSAGWAGVDHDDPLLASAYAAARVFALPSWFETPGLAALEAALAGCAVVITPFGCTREYFGDRVEYARPDRPADDRRGDRPGAGQTGPDPGSAAHVAAHYLWSDVARRTAEVYDQVAG